jgi:hypothetical protein
MHQLQVTTRHLLPPLQRLLLHLPPLQQRVLRVLLLGLLQQLLLLRRW